MELIRYWGIVRARWWLVIGLPAIVALLSLVTYDWSPSILYNTTFRLNVGLEPNPPAAAEYVYNPLDTWMASEYLMDDLASAVRGADFARRVAARLDAEGIAFVGRFGAATEHRVLTISLTWQDPEQLARIADTAIAVLREEAQQLVGPLGQAEPVLRLIDPPVVVPVGRSLRQKLDLPIRLGLAVVTGVAGAFLLDYLDASVQSPSEVEAMGITILAHIPRHR
jgi:hypothetical protein